jgi:hypothetical protein
MPGSLTLLTPDSAEPFFGNIEGVFHEIFCYRGKQNSKVLIIPRTPALSSPGLFHSRPAIRSMALWEQAHDPR